MRWCVYYVGLWRHVGRDMIDFWSVSRCLRISGLACGVLDYNKISSRVL